WLVSANWGARLLIDRTVALAGAILMSLTLIGSGITRRDLFLRRGDLAAPAQPFLFFGRGNQSHGQSSVQSCSSFSESRSRSFCISPFIPLSAPVRAFCIFRHGFWASRRSTRP